MRYFRSESQARLTAQREGRSGLPIGACCEKAIKRQCVCLHSYDCEEHGETCVGSHE